MKKTDVEKIQYKIDALVANFGKAWFLELMAFMIEVRESSYEIKILMARRFFDIYCAFEEIIDYLYEGTVQTVGQVVTNLSMVLLEGELRGKKILVVDDIILHGRALNDVYLYLRDVCGCSVEDIDFKVFVRNEDKKLIESRAFDRLEVEKILDNSRWRSLSGGIINALIITGQPYVSYLPYAEFDMESEAAGQIGRWMEKAEVEDITSCEQRYYGVQSLLWVPQETDPVRNHFSFSSQIMVRIYRYERLSKLVILPYVFLKPLYMEGAREFAGMAEREYLRYVWDKAELGKGRQKQYSPEAGKYICSIMTYLSSIALGDLFLEKCSVSQAEWIDIVENIGLGCKNTLTREKENELLAMLNRNRYCWFRQNDAAEDTVLEDALIKDVREEALKSGRDGKNSINWFMDHYLPLRGRQDEKRAERNEDRMPGLGLMALAQICGTDFQKEMWEKIIKVIDSGRGTLMLSLRKMSGGNMIDSLILPGEQNPACNEEYRICLALPLMQWEAFCALKGTKATESQKGELASEILEKYPDLKALVSAAEVEELAKEDILGEYKDYYLKKIGMYTSFSMLSGAMRTEKEYERKRG